MLSLAIDILPRLNLGGSGDDSGLVDVPIHIAHHRPDGSVEELSLGLG
jgi:hypothetical protein